MSKKISIAPLGDRVVVRPAEQEQEMKSPSGIIIANSGTSEKPSRGEVVAVGPGRIDAGKTISIGVKKGDMVLFAKYGHEEVEVNGEDLYIIGESNILAVIK